MCDATLLAQWVERLEVPVTNPMTDLPLGAPLVLDDVYDVDVVTVESPVSGEPGVTNASQITDAKVACPTCAPPCSIPDEIDGGVDSLGIPTFSRPKFASKADSPGLEITGQIDPLRVDLEVTTEIDFVSVENFQHLLDRLQRSDDGLGKIDSLRHFGPPVMEFYPRVIRE